ncbi:g2968 [Coccomyxa elongata]
MGRFFCKECGFRLYNQRDETPFRGMPAINLDGFVSQPSQHVLCKDASEEVLQRFKNDGLPKYKDFPKEYGGTGEELQL